METGAWVVLETCPAIAREGAPTFAITGLGLIAAVDFGAVRLIGVEGGACDVDVPEEVLG